MLSNPLAIRYPQKSERIRNAWTVKKMRLLDSQGVRRLQCACASRHACMGCCPAALPPSPAVRYKSLSVVACRVGRRVPPHCSSL